MQLYTYGPYVYISPSWRIGGYKNDYNKIYNMYILLYGLAAPKPFIIVEVGPRRRY